MEGRQETRGNGITASNSEQSFKGKKDNSVIYKLNL